MVPNNDCNALLSINGARKRRKVFQSGFGADMDEPFIRASKAVAARSARGLAVDGVVGERRALSAVAIGELHDVVADVGGPVGDQSGEAAAVIGEQRTRGFLELRQVAGHG